ncbi:MAG: hypothetical protein KDG55_03020 [Rhodocyclaceae bacterium]|nr:hypothetical protein [Rhodocyclaceae bacterium]
MSVDSPTVHYQRWANNILRHASDEERGGFRAWAARLLEIREGREFPPVKVQQALQASIDPAFSARSLQLLGRELKRIGWDERDTYERLGISVAGTMAMLTSVGAIAFAAFGSAFSVPMWVVFGSGDEFARILVAACDEVHDDGPETARADAPETEPGPEPASVPDDPEAGSAPMVLINLGAAYSPSMSRRAFYEAARGPWRLAADKRARVRYALVLANGEVLEAYALEAWHPAGTTPYSTRGRDEISRAGHWEFTGRVPPTATREALLALPVGDAFKAGGVNPIRYRNL